MMEDQINCRTQGLATHQEPWDWTSDVPLCQKTDWMLLRSLQWGVTVLPWELVLSGGGLEYWDEATQQTLSMRKLDNLGQQRNNLVEELRGSTIMRDRVYYFTMGVEDLYKYEVDEMWGPGRGHPGNKIPNLTMISTDGSVFKMSLKRMPVEVIMRDQGNTESPTEINKEGLCQLGAVNVAVQWMQKKTEGCNMKRNREDYMKIKRNFFSPPPM